MPTTSVRNPCVAKWVCRDIVYIVGGYSTAGANFVKSTSVFDIATKTFQTAVPVDDLKTARGGYGCSIMDQEGKLVGVMLTNEPDQKNYAELLKIGQETAQTLISSRTGVVNLVVEPLNM